MQCIDGVALKVLIMHANLQYIKQHRTAELLNRGFKVSDKIEPTAEQSDDSPDYEKAQGSLQADDPLAAIKALRLEQLAVCRLKTAQEMQRMRDKTQSNKDDAAD